MGQQVLGIYGLPHQGGYADPGLGVNQGRGVIKHTCIISSADLSHHNLLSLFSPQKKPKKPQRPNKLLPPYCKSEQCLQPKQHTLKSWCPAN